MDARLCAIWSELRSALACASSTFFVVWVCVFSSCSIFAVSAASCALSSAISALCANPGAGARPAAAARAPATATEISLRDMFFILGNDICLTPVPAGGDGETRTPAGAISELEWLQALGVGADPGDLRLGGRDQALVRQITVLSERLLAGVLGDEFGDAANHVHVLLLHVDEQRTRGRVLARGDAVEARRNAV